ncbi:hypothetical protein Pfo_015645 [Paulownia fortunei]|nr:hypothetical protein Pfo_015645 [Paulownia fortunei]
MEDTADEADEALSLCDLPLYNDHSVDEWEEDLTVEPQGSTSMSSSEQDYFEFFSQELSSSTTGFPPENIIFCGKLIPYKQPDASEKDSSKLGESKKQTNIKKKRGWGIFRWKVSLSRSSKRQVRSETGRKSTTHMEKKDHHVSRSSQQSPKKMHNSNKHGKGFSTEVELRDIKSRQSRRHCPSPPPSPMLRFQNYDEKVSGGRNSGSGLQGLIRVMSCGGDHHPNSMVVASTCCTPRH